MHQVLKVKARRVYRCYRVRINTLDYAHIHVARLSYQANLAMPMVHALLYTGTQFDRATRVHMIPCEFAANRELRNTRRRKPKTAADRVYHDVGILRSMCSRSGKYLCSYFPSSLKCRTNFLYTGRPRNHKNSSLRALIVPSLFRERGFCPRRPRSLSLCRSLNATSPPADLPGPRI